MAPLEPAAVERMKRWLAAALVGSKFNYRHSLYVMEDLLHSSKRVWRMTAKQALRLWKRSLKTGAVAEHPLLVYMHYPHCRFKCLFCNTPIAQLPDADAVRRYLEDCRREIEFFAPALDGRDCSLWRVGGGTPSLLDAREMRRWLEPAAKLFSFGPDSVRTIEFHPASSTREKLASARSLGFNRVSFGVQSLNARVLRSVNRGYQDPAMVDRAIRWARGLGFE
ncbi:MAG: radical SAM protein, partial [Elusimicrobia bacterium]|nr:radical SAM protein [Elusimicrobiota bacterium]